MKSNIKEFTIAGSCSSRNIFNSTINENYKDYFHINVSIESVNLISLMSNPVEYDLKLLDSDHKYDNMCVKQDLSKKYLEFLKQHSHLEYLIIDTYADVVNDIRILDENTIITDTPRLRNTSFFNQVNRGYTINIFDNFYEYYKLWTEACDKFFEFINTQCPNLKVILNCSRGVSKYLKNGNIYYEADFAKQNSKENVFRNILDKFILENYDVDVLPFNEDLLANKNHIFGAHPYHYETKYYSEKNIQLNEIIHRNDKFGYDSDYNKKIRLTNREKMINELELINNENKESDIINSINLDDELSKFYTARIDIKNHGDATSSIEIIENSDEDLIVTHPKWFNDKNGIGTQIQSKKMDLNLKIKCIHSGKIGIGLKGIDFRENDERIPIYIKYLEFVLNNEKIIENPIILWHDKSFIFEKEVYDSEILNISIKWQPL